MLLASAIMEMTMQGRSSHEAIRRLAGQLRDLGRQDEAFTEGRAAGVGERLALLHSSAVIRILRSRLQVISGVVPWCLTDGCGSGR